jgi:hypothetical protein
MNDVMKWCVQAAGGASVGVPVRRSEADRELALKLHMVNGLQKVTTIHTHTHTHTHTFYIMTHTVKAWRHSQTYSTR